MSAKTEPKRKSQSTKRYEEMGLVEQQITCNLLMWAAGNAISCPDCGRIMDGRRTMVIEVDHHEGNRTHALCVDCGDSLINGAIKRAVDAGASEDDVRAILDIQDAREMDWELHS